MYHVVQHYDVCMQSHRAGHLPPDNWSNQASERHIQRLGMYSCTKRPRSAGYHIVSNEATHMGIADK